jgi:cytochrome b561
MSFSAQKTQMISWHKWMGITVLLLVAIRLCWRVIKGAPPVSQALPRWQQGLATGVHHLLYLLMFALPLSGWLMTSAFGSSIDYLGFIPLPALMPENEDVGLFLLNVHGILAALLLISVGLHAAGAVKHFVLDRDETLARMLPFLQRFQKSGDKQA